MHLVTFMPVKKTPKEEDNKLKVIMDEMESKNRYISELSETKMVLERRIKELLERSPLGDKEEYVQRINEDREVEMVISTELELTAVNLSKKFDELKVDVERFRTKYRELQHRHAEIEHNYDKLLSLMKKE